jgi:hypothetical protein
LFEPSGPAITTRAIMSDVQDFRVFRHLKLDEESIRNTRSSIVEARANTYS